MFLACTCLVMQQVECYLTRRSPTTERRQVQGENVNEGCYIQGKSTPFILEVQRSMLHTWYDWYNYPLDITCSLGAGVYRQSRGLQSFGGHVQLGVRGFIGFLLAENLRFTLSWITLDMGSDLLVGSGAAVGLLRTETQCTYYPSFGGAGSGIRFTIVVESVESHYYYSLVIF